MKAEEGYDWRSSFSGRRRQADTEWRGAGCLIAVNPSQPEGLFSFTKPVVACDIHREKKQKCVVTGDVRRLLSG